MGKLQPLSNAGYNREEAYFYEQDQKLIQKVRRLERKKKEVSAKQNRYSTEKKAA